MKKSAFTMIELVFVIVVLGILAAVALPRMGGTMSQAQLAKARGDVAAIRTSIASERQKNLVKGINTYPLLLDANDGDLFSVVLTYAIPAGTASGEWQQTGATAYTFKVALSGGEQTVAFTYYPTEVTVGGVVHKAGTFDCDHTDATCRKIVE